MGKKRKFPQDVARFFHPWKSGTNEIPGVRLGTHQRAKMTESSNIIVYNAGGTARRVINNYGQVSYI